MDDQVLLNCADLIEELKTKKSLLEKHDVMVKAFLVLRNEITESGICSDTLIRGALRDAARTDQYWQKMEDEVST